MVAVKSMYKSFNKTELFIWLYLMTRHSLGNYNNGMVQKYTKESLLTVSSLPANH